MTIRLTPRQTRRAIEQLGIERPILSAFGFVDPAVRVRYAWHAHSRHQLLVAPAGTIVVETSERLHLCDAGTGIWIPAGCRHATSVGSHAAMSLFFPARQYTSPVSQPSGIAITPLLRQLAALGASKTHGLSRDELQSLYRVLFSLVRRAVTTTRRPTLPHPRSAGLRRAVQHVIEHLATCRIGDLARAGGMSERSLRRRFAEELGMTPERYLYRARLLMSMQMLSAAPASTILDIAAAVGYSSQSAFAAAFKQAFGMSPRDARSRQSVLQP